MHFGVSADDLHIYHCHNNAEDNQIHLIKRHINYLIDSHPHADPEIHSQTSQINCS